MYGWIWRHLPGNAPVRALTSLVLALGVVYLLFQFVFPWAEPLLPFGDATINGGGSGGSGNVQPVSPSSGDRTGSTASPGAGASHGTTSLNGAGAPDPRLSPSSVPSSVIPGVLSA